MASGVAPINRKSSVNDHGHLVHLDMLRGLAALGVVVGHVRGFLVLPYAVSPSETLAGFTFYFVTSLGHQCVLAFFALSGFLVGGQALGSILAGEWSFSHYLLRRLTRLWTVLLPALFLTWIFDVMGQTLGGSAGYDGAYFGLIASGPQIGAPADLSLKTFVANAAFMQTITAPVFGSNGPLWSIANEFWYYITFPLIAQGLIGKGRATARVLFGLIGLGIAMLLPAEMLILGSIWVMGAVAGYLTKLLPRRVIVAIWLPSSIVAIAAFVVLDKLRPGLSSDLLLGVAFSALLPALAVLPSPGRTYAGLATSSAAISYTLYATHFPLLAFIWFAGLAPQKWPVGGYAIALVAAFLGAALVHAAGMWWLFERNTDTFRRIIQSWLRFAGANISKMKVPQ
jgi:peptidoglycan/LPS O-acetylase OafA/YrhL